jgi:hypothetical protein
MNLLLEINPYAQLYCHTRDILGRSKTTKLALVGIPRPGCDTRQYNQPTVKEVTMVIDGKENIIAPQQLVLHWIDGRPLMILDLHSYSFCLRYLLLFPYSKQQRDNLYRSTTVKGACDDF